MPEERMYTIEEIKAAFWKKFHRAGELWFDYLGNEEDAEGSTMSKWEDFAEFLDEKPSETGNHGT